MALQTKTLTANGSRGYHKFTLTVTEDSIIESSNTSLLSFTFKIAPIIAGYDWSSHSTQKYTITIGSNTYTGTFPTYNGSSTVTIMSKSGISVEHNTDGSKSITVSFVYDDTGSATYTPGDASKSGTMTLTAISTGVIYVNNGSSWDAYQVYIDNGSSWDRYIPYIDNGSDWDICN